MDQRISIRQLEVFRAVMEWVAADRLDFGVAFEIEGHSQVAIEPLITVPLVCHMPTDSELAAR